MSGVCQMSVFQWVIYAFACALYLAYEAIKALLLRPPAFGFAVGPYSGLMA